MDTDSHKKMKEESGVQPEPSINTSAENDKAEFKVKESPIRSLLNDFNIMRALL